MAEISDPERRTLLAAELALGVLDGAERAEALRLKLVDRDFAEEVERWEARLSPLCETARDEDVPAGLWDRIEARIPSSNPAAVVPTAARWRAAAAALAAVAAALLLVLILRPASSPLVAPVAVAQLTGDAGARLAARYDAASGMLRIEAEEMPDSPLAPELWIIPADGTPRSLGIVAARGVTEFAVPSALRGFVARGATLAVTMEDRATAPHAAPGSAPVAAGKISIV